MRDPKLWLLMLLSVQALAEQGLESGGDEQHACPLGARYKNFRKYLYTYSAESRNGVAGTANLRNGPKVSCKVELEVLHACNFILHTTECSLSEVSVIDPQGQPVYRQAAGSEAFQAAMGRNPLSFEVEKMTDVSLYPKEQEPKNILNVKRGIISALIAPALNWEDNREMATIHGVCKGSVVTNDREDIDTDVTVHRWDLSKCSHFSPIRLASSPLALIRGLHTPLSMLVSSSQECNYKFDNRRRHMTAALCTEKHLFRPFSHDEQYGISSVVTQTLTLQDSAKINKRYFDIDSRMLRELHLEEAEDKSPMQSKDTALSTMRDLSSLSPEQGQQRTGLFHKLLTEIRGLHNRTLAAAVEDMMALSAPLTWQALAQCGTPECRSALLFQLRKPNVAGPVSDAIVYAMSLAGLQTSPEEIWNLLSMAEIRSTRPVMYALSYAVTNLYNHEVHHEVFDAVADFLESRLGDCTGEEEQIFLILRVIGMIGMPVQEKVEPALLRCMSQSAASPLVQRTAIKALRKMTLTPEIKDAMLTIYQDENALPQKRVAAYLIIMRDPGGQNTFRAVVNYFKTQMQDPEVWNFVASHLANLKKDGLDPEYEDAYFEEFGDLNTENIKYRHQLWNNPYIGQLESQVIAEQYSRLPKEVILKINDVSPMMGLPIDNLELGFEGEGLEPLAEALVGEDALIPNLLFTIMNRLSGNTSPQVKKLFDKLIASVQGDRQRRQVPQDLLKELSDNINKFVERLNSQGSPEGLAYLRLLRQELGYIRTSDFKQLSEDIAKYAAIIFKNMPTRAVKSLLSGMDNELYAHYIFMDENMVLPTAAGFPLKFSLSGVFAPGAKGGVSISPNMHQLSFMPSAGVEFVTHMGVHIPEFVTAGMEMHTNLYHGSALNAKVTLTDGQFKLSIPPPESNVQLFSISNKLLSVSSSQPKIVPSLVEDRTDTNECHPLFTGLKYCTTMRYSNASSNNEAPYYPLTGETKFAVELQSTGEVTEYTAAIAYKLLREGKEGRHKVDSVKVTLKIEGSEPSEATATMKYNRNKSIFTTDLQIPDYDFEAGLKLTAGDSNVKGRKMRGFTIDVTNKNIPQLSLVARARLESMKDALVQVEMDIPSLHSKATTTASLKKENGLILQLESNIGIPKMSSLQTAIVRYDENKVEVELKSDLNSDFDKLFPNMESMRNNLQTAIDDMLDQKVPKTDMKLRHIVSKGFEAVNIWLDKVAADVPYVKSMRSRRSIPELPPVPEKLFMKWETLFRYQFNKGRMTISLPLPLGGQTSDDLKLPPKLSIPKIYVPEIGLDIPANTIRIPSFTIPQNVDLSMPMLGLAELTTKFTSSICNWEASALGGNNTIDVPSLIGQYKIISDCPLQFKAEGAGMIMGTFEDSFKYVVNSSLSHSLLDVSFSASETIAIAEDVVGRANYRLQASSPLGLSASLHSSSQSLTSGDQLKGDGDIDGDIKVGPLFARFLYTVSYILSEPVSSGESTFKLESSLIQLENTINGEYKDEVMSLRSKTTTPNEALTHMLEMKVESCKFSLRSDATGKVLSNTLNNKIDLGIACQAANLKVETEADDGTNRAYAVLSGTLNSGGLETTVDGSVVFDSCRGSHKSFHKIHVVAGLTTSGTTNLQCSPLTFENAFDGKIDDTRATISVTSKAAGRDNNGELKVEGTVTSSQAAVNTALKGNLFDADMDYTSKIGLSREGLTFADSMTGALQGMTAKNSHSLKVTLWTLALRSKSDCFVCDGTSYKHDIKVNLKPFVATFNTDNDIELFDMSLSNEGHLKLEPLKIDLSGSITGATTGGDLIKHSCSINYADLAGFIKCNTNAKVSETQLSHNLDLQYAGLASKFTSEALINSKILRLESTLKTMAEPFSLTVDGILNSDSEVKFYGKHKGQLYSKLLFRAEPLGIAHSHDCRASATHELPSGAFHETHLENKLEGVLTPSEQSWQWKTKSKLNDHAYNQDINAYNNDEKMGVEFAGVVFTNVFNKAAMSDDPEFQSDHSFENQEFSFSAFLKYDKNSDSHILSLPFIDNLPEAFEDLKASIIHFLESVREYMISLEIDNVLAQFRTTLENLPQDVENYIRDLDLEGKFKQANEALVSWMQSYAISVDDLEIFVENVREDFEKSLLDTASKIRGILVAFKDFVESGTWSDTISEFFTQLGTDLKDFDEKYEISKTLTRALEAIEEIIRQIDMEKLTDSSLAWLQEVDAKYGIRDWLQEKVSELKQVIETFDVTMLAQDIKDYIVSFDLIEFIGRISDKLPTEDIKNTLETMKDILVNWLDEYEIDRKINSVISKIQDLLQRYEIDKKFEMLANDFIELIKQYKVHETLQQVVDELKKIEIEFYFNKIKFFLDDIIIQLKSIDFKQSIEDLNEYISKTVKAIQEFHYKLNIDNTNQKISEIIEYVNDHIRTYEIPQKIEASRQFLREVQSTIWNYLDQLKATRVGELLTMLKDVLDKTAYKDIQFKIQDMLQDMRQRISDMDIKAEITYYLKRASESYTNVLAYISLQLDKLIEAIRQIAKDQEILDQISNSFQGILDALKKAELKIPSFTVPLTGLSIPEVTLALQNLQDIEIPSQITIPEFTFLDVIPVASITLDFEELKQMIINLIDQISAFELPMVELEAMFGDLRVLYMSDLPDLTFQGITLSEIRIPDITLPKLNCENFDITKLPIPEVKLPEIPSEVQVPAFGKIYGEVRISSPHYTLVTGATLENSTTAPKSPQFTATLSSQAKSTLELLEFSLDGTLRLEAPRMKKMVLKETLKASHMAFNIDHEGNLIFSGPSAELTAKTTAKATTEVYTADMENTFELALKNGISASMDTNYNHNLNIPKADISSQVTMTQTSKAQFEPGTISVTVGTIGSGKLSVNDFLDEGTHSSKLECNVNIGAATCHFNGETKSRALTLMQDINIESAIVSLTINARIETETPFIKSSVLVLKGVAEIEDLKIDLKAYHDAELIGKASGRISNSLEFLAKPFEIVMDSKNKGNVKIIFPLKLTGKVDLQNDYGIIFNSEKQRVCLMGLARFNQYKYNHNFTLDNNQFDVGIYGTMNGEANLDFLTVPLTIPEITLPYFDVKTPMIKDVSLWEDYGLNTLLSTPRQSFDMNLNLMYQKNPDTHALYFDLVPVYNMINSNAELLQTYFEAGRDWVFINLMDSYNQAKSQYEKHKIETSRQPPRYFRVPGYTIPVLNIEVSAFRAEMPAFSFLIPKEVSTPSFKVPALAFSVPSYTVVLPSPELPVLHVPETLRELTLPTFRLPEVQNSIMTPALGNMTFDFSFKSSVITLNANGGVYNQSDILTKLATTSTSVFDVLKGKFEGTTRLTMNRGLKMATAVALEHNNVEGTHDGSLSCTGRGLEATTANVVKVNLPVLTLELEQESRAHSHSSPNFGTKLKGKYNFNIPYIDIKGNGVIEQNLDIGLESISIFVDSSTKGKLDGTVMERGHFSGDLENVVSFFLNANGQRSSINTAVQVNYDHDNSKILSTEMSNVLALEASLRRVYGEIKYRCINDANIASFSTNGKHSAQVSLEMVPLTTILLKVDLDTSQPSTIGDATVVQKIDLDLTAEKQSLKWSGREQITSIVHACDLVLANSKEEVRMEATQSLEAHLSFLKSIKLPVYQKTLWDVLKFDQVTNTEERQFINGSTIVVYTKSPDGWKFTRRDMLRLIRNINDFLDYNNLIDYVSLSHIFATPHIDVPFTNLNIQSIHVDLTKEIPDTITVPQIDINLPALPQVTIPELEIGTKHFEGEHITLKLPSFEAIFSGISLPEFLDDILQLPCGIPPFQIPRRYIEIPEMSLKLPVAIFIPTFGNLSTTVKVSSPIYTETWTTTVENSYPEILTSLKAGCTSTMAFLEYDLDAKATWNFFDDDFSMRGISKLTHTDFNINWQHTLTQNARTKRQESQDSSSQHTLNVDIRSPTFIDVSCRYASHKNGITASVSSPSAGFMGFQLQRRSPSQYYGKLFGRYPSSPDKDTDMVTVKATLRNSEKLSLQIAWNWNAVSDILYGVKQNTPHVAVSLKKFINKYHTAHFGMDLNRASLKMKNSISNTIERAYHEVPQMFNSMENSIEQISQQTQEVLTRAANGIPSVDFPEMRSRFSKKAKELYKYYENSARILLDAIMQFLRETKFHLPGLEEKLSGQEIYHRVRQSVSAAIEQATRWFTSLMETIYYYISSTEITLPYFDKVIRGQEILDSLPTMESIEEHVRDAMKRWENLRLETLFKSLNDFLKLCIMKVEELISSLQTVQLNELLSEVRYHLAEAGSTPVMEEIRSKLAEAQQNAATYKDVAKMKIQDMYNGMTVENINQTVVFAVDVFESHFLGGANEFHDLLRHHTQGAEPYIKIYNKKAELEVPLPFFWKSFNEWPTQTRE